MIDKKIAEGLKKGIGMIFEKIDIIIDKKVSIKVKDEISLQMKSQMQMQPLTASSTNEMKVFK